MEDRGDHHAPVGRGTHRGDGACRETGEVRVDGDAVPDHQQGTPRTINDLTRDGTRGPDRRSDLPRIRPGDLDMRGTHARFINALPRQRNRIDHIVRGSIASGKQYLSEGLRPRVANAHRVLYRGNRRPQSEAAVS